MNNTTHRPKQHFNSLTMTTIQSIFYVTIFVMGGVGNILVLLVIKGKKSLRRANDYFIWNLAIGDLLVLFISIPVDFYNKVVQASMSSGYIICKFLWPLMTLALFTSVFTLTCMAVERSRVICRPMARKLRGIPLCTLIVIIWFAAVLCVLPLVIVAVPDPVTGSCDERWPNMGMRKAYTAAVTALQYVLPLIIITIAYTKLSYQLEKSRQFRISNAANAGSQQMLHRSESSKINKNLRTIVTSFAVFMLPKHIAWLWLDFGQGDRYGHFDQVLIFAEVMLYIHSSLNPLVYGTVMRDYRLGFKRYLKRICWCRNQDHQTNSFSLQNRISPIQQ